MTESHATETQDFAEMLNGMPDGWVGANNVKFTSATAARVTAEMPIKPQHLQAYGLVHGGVYAALIETLASVGAALTVMPKGKSAVGLENHTSFIHACREGTLHAEALPITRGSRSQVWEVTIRDDGKRIISTGRVRMLVLEAESAVAGGNLTLKGG